MSLLKDKLTRGVETEQKNQKDPSAETVLQQPNSINGPMITSDLQMEEGVRTTDLKTSQATNQTTNPLSLLKEDFSQFKAELMNIFKDKDMKSQSAQRERKQISSLNLLKEDFSLLKEDLTNVFKLGFSKDKDCKAPKEDSLITAEKPDTSEDNRTNSLCGVSKNRGEKEFKKTISEKRKERMSVSQTSRPDWTSAPRRNLSEETEETTNTGNMTDQESEESGLEDGELDLNLHERRTGSESQLCQENVLSYDTDEEKTTDSALESKDCDDYSMEEEEEEEEEEEDDNPLMSLSWETPGLSVSGNESNNIMRGQPEGELWPVKEYACYLTLDPNTANPELLLSEDNRWVTRAWKNHQYLEHPDRFQSCPQVLCREGLLERFYWEVEWIGGADIGVTYNSISRDGDVGSCLLGHNNKSWSLECSEGSYTPCHDNKRFRSSSPTPFNHTVGVYLDWAGGSLSFYSVSPERMTHLHTFTTTFTEPLYPAFWVWGLDASVTICQVMFEWERLLQ